VIFGEFPLDKAAGAILAHSLRTGRIAFKKGRLLSDADIEALQDAGIESVTAARLEAGDVNEDDAARRVAEPLTGLNLSASAPFTGRVNLFATAHGVVTIDPAIEALNRIDEGVTAATLPRWEVVQPKQIVATIKIIPFAVPEQVVAECERIAGVTDNPIMVAPFKPKTFGLIQTRLPGTKETVLDKTAAVLAARVEGLDGTLSHENRCAHDTASVAAAIGDMAANGCDVVLVAGASAIIDRRDVIPAGIEQAGGQVDHFGMPVDPGNLLLVGRVTSVPVVGLPGCARSPKFNGVDLVLQRLAAELPLDSQDITAMGVGGLLKETAARSLPRAAKREDETAPRAPRIAAIILAAGQSRRMGRVNKLLAPVDGKPMVRWAVEAAAGSAADPLVVVLGHQARQVREALADFDVTFVENPDFADGISSSVKQGVAALPEAMDGALICLGDMPRVTAGAIDRLVAAFNAVEGREICIPTWQGKRGNPVLIGRRFFPEIQEITGDVGARHLISAYPDLCCEVEMSGDAVLVDVDTQQALAALAE
jgi:molybdenum cofactor cytidylyltransferase